ncbi:MAG: hypothetical protein KatS3mg105_0873 [Gemmatales bacterium]|nr:MAG: hypothetical protein KatS3mg105_0873 [Gemmatales bacterium]
MRRTVVVLIAWVSCACLLEAAPPADKNAQTQMLSSEQVRAILDQAVSGDGFDPGTPFKDVLAFFTKQYHLKFIVDQGAFRKAYQIERAEDLPVSTSKYVNIRLSTVLDYLTEPFDATWVQCGTEIWIVPKSLVGQRLKGQTINIDFANTALDQVLRELSSRTGSSIVLDRRRCAEQAEEKITAAFKNVSLGSALKIVANMVELQAVLIGKVFYVTTPENAARLRKEEAERLEREAPSAEFKLGDLPTPPVLRPLKRFEKEYKD